MNHSLLLFTLFAMPALGLGATGQYPCTNAVYYARSLAGRGEFLLCQTSPSRLSVLYGPIKTYTPDLEGEIHEKDVRVSQQKGQCRITLPLPPYQLVLNVALTPPFAPDTLHLEHPTQGNTSIRLDNTTRIQYLKELQPVKATCEKI